MPNSLAIKIERTLRGIAFIAFFLTWVVIFVGESLLRRFYYPILKDWFKKKTGLVPHNYVAKYFCFTFMDIYGIKVVSLSNEIFKNKDLEPCVVMFTHGSNLDGFAIQLIFPFYLCFVAKKILFQIPILAQVFNVIECIPIDRKNLESAKASLHIAEEFIKKEKKSIAIAPEGTRRRKGSDDESGRIQPLKKGAFHLTKACNVNVVPVITVGAFRMWQPGQFFPNPGTIMIDILPLIPKEKVEKMNVDELLHEVKESLEKGAKEIPKNLDFSNPDKKYGLFIFFFIYFWFWVYQAYRLLRLFI